MVNRPTIYESLRNPKKIRKSTRLQVTLRIRLTNRLKRILTIIARSTRNMMMRHNSLTNLNPSNQLTNPLYDTGHLMSQNRRSDSMPAYLLEISTAYPTRTHPNQNLRFTYRWNWKILQLQSSILLDNSGLHLSPTILHAERRESQSKGYSKPNHQFNEQQE